MKCFNHSDLSGVGLCKHCSRALCHECAADSGYGLACRNLHEREVAAVSELVSRSVMSQAQGGLPRYVTSIFYVCLGAIFIGYELWFAPYDPGFGVVLGGAFVAYGLYLAAVRRRSFRSASKA